MSIPALPLTDNPVDLLSEAAEELEETLDALLVGEMSCDGVDGWLLTLNGLIDDLSSLVASIEDAYFAA